MTKFIFGSKIELNLCHYLLWECSNSNLYSVRQIHRILLVLTLACTAAGFILIFVVKNGVYIGVSVSKLKYLFFWNWINAYVLNQE